MLAFQKIAQQKNTAGAILQCFRRRSLDEADLLKD
jgi:hypothetical protein